MEVLSVSELDLTLDTLTAHSPKDAPWLAHVTRMNGDSLSIGLGSPLAVDSRGDLLTAEHREEITVLSWVQADGNPPYYFGKPPVPRATHNFVFFTEGHWSEFPSETGIDVQTAREVLRDFFAGADLPARIEWTEV